MFISAAILAIVIWCAYSFWSKLCDIEQKLFRLHDEASLSLQEIEKQIDLLQSIASRIEDNTDNSSNYN